MATFTRPIKGSPRISRDFARHAREGSVNPGVDYATPIGTAVYAPAAGTVQVDDDHAGGAAGISLVIYHAGGYSSDLLHLSRNVVRKGQRVKQGQLVGYSGSTGASTGPHLHWTLRTSHIDWYGNAGNIDGETKLRRAQPLPAPSASVRWDQERLNVWRRHWGLPPILVDGVRGPQTIAATKHAQGRFGITADGVAGPITDAHLIKNPTVTEKPQPAPAPRPVEPLDPEPMPERGPQLIEPAPIPTPEPSPAPAPIPPRLDYTMPTVSVPPTPDVILPANVRAGLYLGNWVAGVALAATAAGVVALGAPAPPALVVAIAVYGVISSAISGLARANTTTTKN